MNTKQCAELAGMAMIGDGMLALVAPEGHCRLWDAGPAWWRKMLDPFVQHPNVTRCLGAAELALGLWISLRAEDEGAAAN